NEALQSVRNGWPLLVMQGSGRFADELSAVIRDSQSAKSTELTEIARSNRVTLFHVDDSAKKLKDGEFLPAQIQPYQLGLLPAAAFLAALQKQAATPPTPQGDRTPDLHETEFVLEVLKLAAKVAPLLLL